MAVDLVYMLDRLELEVSTWPRPIPGRPFPDLRSARSLCEGAIARPGAFAFYYPNLNVLNGGAPTPAAKASPEWPALKGACASAGGGLSYCGWDR
jgi:hypothetical protein